MDRVEGVVEKMRVYLGLEQVHFNTGALVVEGNRFGKKLLEA